MKEKTNERAEQTAARLVNIRTVSALVSSRSSLLNARRLNSTNIDDSKQSPANQMPQHVWKLQPKNIAHRRDKHSNQTCEITLVDAGMGTLVTGWCYMSTF